MYKSNILYSEAVREFKKRFIITVLEENRGNQCKAARQLGMHRNTLSRTMQELKIDVRPLRQASTPQRASRHAGKKTSSLVQFQASVQRLWLCRQTLGCRAAAKDTIELGSGIL